MRIPADALCSRFAAGSAAATSLPRTRAVDHSATATNRASKLAIAIGILAVAARLIFINQPYIDHWSWRQSDVAAITRNFYENGFLFVWPQINWTGDATGYVGTEFPILPFLAAVCYKIAGVQGWIGRSQAVIFFAASLPFFFLVVRETFGSNAAVWATLFFSFAPLNLFAGRSFIPDVPSLSLSIVGLYFFLRWVRDRGQMAFFVAATAISLSLLIKITSIVIAAPLLYLTVAAVYDRRTPGNSGAQRAPLQTQLLVFAVIAILPSIAWYWHAYQIAADFYPHHFFGAGGVRIESFSWYAAIVWRVATLSLSPVVTLLALIGLFVVPRLQRCTHADKGRSNCSLLFHWWLAAMILFIVVAGYGNRHPWYQLPLVPIAAAFAGAACAFCASRISSRRVAATLSLLLASSFAILSYFYVQPFYEPSAAQLRDAGLALTKITAPDALIVAADTGDPTIFYYAHRKGWHFLETDAVYGGNPADSQAAIDDLEKLRRRGATHFVFTVNTFWWLKSYPEFAQHLADNATLIEATPVFEIYKLKSIAR
ncbi:MAG TPA: glycosyltransferase family 39 protein [Candidatus Udaeobacter sp.]|jgi:4-amino-4-deoxy-L-arabinose transferase-like glycosyltransferase|nr:glycosyltransferase family 39 protein [Candidatus Udaeobacter sp.]